MIGTGVGIMVLQAAMNYYRITSATSLFSEEILLSNFNPLTMIASCSIFAGFTVLDVKIDLSFWSKMTFFAYLIHAGIRDILLLVVERISLQYVWITIPIFMIVIIVLSSIAAAVYSQCWNLLNKRFDFSGKIKRIFVPNSC